MALLGSSIDPSLFSNDYSGFANAGAIQGQSYAQLGKDIGGAIQGAADMYQAGKKQSNLYSSQKKANASYIDSAITMLGDKDPAMVAQLQNERSMMYDPSLSLEQQVQIGGAIDIMLFKMDTCGHCKNFMPVWEHLKKELSNKYNFIMYDSNKDIDKVKEYNVDGFPTLIKNGNTVTQYDGDRDYESVKYFIMNQNMFL